MIAPTGPTSRKSDPDTSAAAVPSPERLSTLQAQVMDAFNWETALGYTDDELCRFRFPNHTPGTVVKRRSELTRAGLLRDTGKRRPVRRTGRMAVVWGPA